MDLEERIKQLSNAIALMAFALRMQRMTIKEQAIYFNSLVRR